MAPAPLDPNRAPVPCAMNGCGRMQGPGARRGYCARCYRRLRVNGMIEVRGNPELRRPIPERFTPTPIKDLSWQIADEIELMRELCRRNFWTFFLYGFGDGLSPKGQRWIDPDIHEPLANWFQAHIEDWLAKRAEGTVEQKHLAVVVHREMGKSRMITAAGQMWLHLRDPELSSYTGSESLDLAQRILNIIRGKLDGTDPHALFHRLYGNWSTNARMWTGKAITHAARKETSRADPSLGTFAVETSIVGAHPDAIFYDDPISYERMLSDTNWLATVNSQVTSLFPVIQSDGLVVWDGTRYDDDDHFGVAFREEGIATLSGMETDGIAPTEGGKWHVYFLAGRDRDGKPTSPKVWPESRLLQYQRREPLRYAAQVMNDPQLSEFNPITKDQIRQCVVKPSDVPWSALRFGICCDVAFWDGKSRERKDETVFIVHGYPRNGSGDVYVVEAHGSAYWRTEDLANRLVATVQRYRRQGRRIIGISDEVPMGGRKGEWQIVLKNYFADANEPMPPFFEFRRGGTRKTDRMVAAASFWVDGHVKVVEGAPGTERLMEQMAKIGQYLISSRLHNDWVDAHSDAFQPEFYQPMRRVGPQKPPYERGSIPIHVDGLDERLFDSHEDADWLNQCPREPIR